MAEFDERLWGATVDYVTVGVDGGMTVVFRDRTGGNTSVSTATKKISRLAGISRKV